MIRRLLVLILATLLLLAAWLIVTPSPIDPVSWQPPEAAALAANEVTRPNIRLQAADLLALGEIYGPEDVAVDAAGIVHAGTQDGLIKRIHPDGRVETWITDLRRPLGLHFDAAGKLIVADAWLGLLSISPDGEVKQLTNSADGQAFAFTNDLDIASDGRIYFTDASRKWHQPDYVLDLLEARPHGRLLVYDPASGNTTTLLEGLYFANGVALSENEDFVLVNETGRYRIQRYWLKGPRAGSHDVFIDKLPGFPDGISANRQGLFWLALPTPRLANVDFMHPRPWLKNLVAKLPDFLKPRAMEYGLVLGLDEAGNIVHSLHDPGGRHLKEITSVEEHAGHLYFGSLHNDRIGRLRVPER